MATTTRVHVPEQDTFKIGDRNFTVTAWPAMFGLSIQERLANGLSADLMKDMIVKSTSVDSIAIDDKKFDQVFSRKYKDLMELVQKIMIFNFGEMDEDAFDEISDENDAGKGTASPKELSDT